MQNPADFPAPSLLRQLAAMFYDSWLVLATLIFSVALLVGLRVLVDGTPATGEHALGGAWRLPTFVVMLLVSCHFFVYFWHKSGQTLAMQTWRIKVVADNGDAINYRQAYLRFLAAGLSMACLGLGYLWMLVDRQNKSWHDHLSGTRLVLLPKPAKS
ncbi:MAG TPA: RDD family protein [Pseudomonadales bacterium]